MEPGFLLPHTLLTPDQKRDKIPPRAEQLRALSPSTTASSSEVEGSSSPCPPLQEINAEQILHNMAGEQFHPRSFREKPKTEEIQLLGNLFNAPCLEVLPLLALLHCAVTT